ncbi:helix-turn-helix transcriptional regulator [Chengkuizengella axinellae]|uniref:YafY family protein n=1 Tax=Chengkuizengella axinellae TaxID=3064388 RepID=A0ABT9J2M0_9BACL|nr:YafY family protein [Chengkuizengella sp. 2205SS18-9]MDP5275859.1 YafY family protein [Chengkuizengella sp. 2205SS18-9]
MKKMERLVGIIYALKEHQKLTAKQIANKFEVSERTIYRDIEALSQLNIPIVALEGYDGGYQIDDKYFVPSVAFSENEILYLLMSLRLGEMINVPNMKEDYESLKYKLLNILDENKKEKYLQLLDRVHFYINDIAPEAYKQDIMQHVIESFFEYKNLNIKYYTPKKDELITREVSPYVISFDKGGWYLNSYCHVREEKRTFRFDRIHHIEMSKNTYSPKLIQDYFEEREGNSGIYVTLEMRKSLYETMKQDYVFENAVVKEIGEHVQLTFWSYDEEVLKLSIMNVEEVTILDPPDLIEQMKSACKKILNKYEQL